MTRETCREMLEARAALTFGNMASATNTIRARRTTLSTVHDCSSRVLCGSGAMAARETGHPI